ncbi:hypothetical protein N9E48_01810 [Paracoccaceae bacterium]|nr:hypothetical protein [Paracoccaceae bacterium]
MRTLITALMLIVALVNPVFAENAWKYRIWDREKVREILTKGKVVAEYSFQRTYFKVMSHKKKYYRCTFEVSTWNVDQPLEVYCVKERNLISKS